MKRMRMKDKKNEDENDHLVARGERAGEKDGDMAAWAGGPL